MKNALAICLILFVVSCHTEPPCDVPEPFMGPSLNFYINKDSLTSFTNNQLLNMQIMFTEKNNFIPIDSFYYFYPNDTIYINSHKTTPITISAGTFAERTNYTSLDVKDYNFLIVFRKANIIDTVSGVNYTTQTNKINWCNGNGYIDITTLTSVQYNFNNSLVSNMNDSTLIHR